MSLFFFIFTACSEPISSQSEFVLGTVCTITLYDEGKPQVYRDIFNRLREIENRMSMNIQGNDTDRINKAAGIEAVKVHDDVYKVVERGLYFAGLSGGAFDLTVGPLVSLWDIGGENPGIPPQDEINSALSRVNWNDVELDGVNKTVFLKKSGMAIDLGAIAKGYAADEAALIIKKAGIPRAIIDLGGNILIVGEKKDKSPWRVGIQDPLSGRGDYFGIVQINQKSVVTSGTYQRYFVVDSVQYHHILLPSTGYPVRNGLLSVTVMTGISMDADALSTAVFVLGYEEGRALIDSLEGVEAVFAFEDMSVRKTSGADFSLTDTRYRIIPD